MIDSLDARMARILARMSVISEQPARSYEGVSVHGGERNTEPHLNARPMLDEFRERYNGAHSQKSKREVIDAAELALKHATMSKKPPPFPGTVEWRIAIAREPGTVEDVAYKFGCTERHVYRMRAITKEAD